MKTSELEGALLDYWVAKAEGKKAIVRHYPGVSKCYLVDSRTVSGRSFRPSSSWEEGGPIIEREMIKVSPRGGYWLSAGMDTPAGQAQFGPTPLIAAMRCYVASKLGDEVDIPDELMTKESDMGSLSYTYNHFGYMLTYKGKPIGGAGTRVRGRKLPSNLNLYREHAEREIAALRAGGGQARFRDAMAKIDSEELLP